MHTVLTPVMLVSFLFTNINCGNFTSKKNGEAPWLLLASGINQNTESIDEPQGGGSSGGGGASPLVPPTGMFFLHPDHLGSVSMITDGFGNVITGGNNGGKSSINYKPYGEINRTDSSGPDITKFKYTGQEEDKESGLLYYKARYYDPALGRFLQADSFTTDDNLYGYNRYMYVNGNPIKYVDPTGNYNAKNFMQDAVTYLTFQAIGNTNSMTEKFMLYKAGVKEKYNHRNEKGSSFWRSDVGNLYKARHPLNLIGAIYAAMNYAVGRILAPITKKNPQIKKVKGGYVVTNGPLVAGGISLGHFAVTSDDNEATIRHEAAHIGQYNEMGPEGYLLNLGDSPFKGARWGERDADNRAGTWSYSNDSIKNLVWATIIVLAFSRGRSQQEINQASYDMGLAFFLEGLGYVP